MAEIIFNTTQPSTNFESQIDNLQTTLASLNQQVIFLQEKLQEKDQDIAELEMRLSQCNDSEVIPSVQEQATQNLPKIDSTLTIVGVVIRLYQYIFPPGKDDSVLN